jgi:predicted O-methyltransferase YrrM
MMRSSTAWPSAAVRALRVPRYTIELLRYFAGLRGPRTSLTVAETSLLRSLAQNKRCVVEVGVDEGATSKELCQVLHLEGLLYLVDPYLTRVRFERWLGFSGAAFIARRTLKRWRGCVRFVGLPSVAAARSGAIAGPVDLVFIDADHRYESVREDLLAWAPRLAPSGVAALHDSRPSSQRPGLGLETGPVRLAAELEAGTWGPWALSGAADTLTAWHLRR